MPRKFVIGFFVFVLIMIGILVFNMFYFAEDAESGTPEAGGGARQESLLQQGYFVSCDVLFPGSAFTPA